MDVPFLMFLTSSLATSSHTLSMSKAIVDKPPKQYFAHGISFIPTISKSLGANMPFLDSSSIKPSAISSYAQMISEGSLSQERTYFDAS